MIKVVNIRSIGRTTVFQPHQFYIGRANRSWHVGQSLLHNHFTTGTRDEMCDAFEQYLNDVISWRKFNLAAPVTDMPKVQWMWTWKGLLEAKHILDTHGKIELVCWCAPARCHGDSIARVLPTLPTQQ